MGMMIRCGKATKWWRKMMGAPIFRFNLQKNSKEIAHPAQLINYWESEFECFFSLVIYPLTKTLALVAFGSVVPLNRGFTEARCKVATLWATVFFNRAGGTFGAPIRLVRQWCNFGGRSRCRGVVTWCFGILAGSMWPKVNGSNIHCRVIQRVET